MLTVLEGISKILKKGFENVEGQLNGVKRNVNTMSDNLVGMNNAMDRNFDELITGQDSLTCDTQSESSRVSNKRKRTESGGSHNEDSSVLDSLQRDLDADRSVGTPLRDGVAAFVKSAFNKQLDTEELKAKKVKFAFPDNVDCFATPKVNEAVWTKLSHGAKARDRSWQNNHDTFLHSVTAFTRVVDLLRANEKAGPWVKEALGLSAETLTLFSTLNADWTKARRDDIRPSLPEEFKRLASKEVKASNKYLFGDDLETTIKSLESHNRLSKKMDHSGQKPFRQNNNNNNNKSFNANKDKRGKSRWQARRDNNSRDRQQNNKRDSNKDFHRRGSSKS